MKNKHSPKEKQISHQPKDVEEKRREKVTISRILQSTSDEKCHIYSSLLLFATCKTLIFFLMLIAS